MIERVARDPEVDVDKLDRLLGMQERILDREAKIAYDDAMSEMQPQLPVVGACKARYGPDHPRDLADVRRMNAMREAGDALEAMATHLIGTLEVETGGDWTMTRERVSDLTDAWRRAKRHG